MVRTTKDPEERRVEIIDAALTLFRRKGFDQTLVSDIVKELGVAQGTFYYYFKSKEEVLDALIHRELVEDEGFVQDAIDRGVPALEITKLALRRFLRLWSEYNGRLPCLLVFEIGDQRLVERMQRQYMDRVTNYIRKIVEKGVAEGTMKVTWLDETASVLHNLLDGLIDAMRAGADSESLARRAMVIEPMFCGGLGLPDGSFSFRELFCDMGRPQT